MKLTPNFTLREMLYGSNDRLLNSLTPADQKFFKDAVEEELNDQIIKNLTQVARVLEIIRAYLGEPVFVTCGFRPKAWELYKSRTGKSKHTTGEAVDITFLKASLQYVYDWMNTNIRVGGRGINHDAQFIHYDIRNNFAEWDY